MSSRSSKPAGGQAESSPPAGLVRVGVDTGGTFTDVILQGPGGQLRVHKLLSTPTDPSRAIGDGVGILEEQIQRPVDEVIHGTTVATNALLERQGAKVAFVTTAGFEDLLWMGRQARPELYALEIKGVAPLVAQGMCFGVEERVGADGAVIHQMSQDEVTRVVEAVKATGCEAVVICLLHAYANPDHEQRLARAFRAAKKSWHVTASAQVTATFREFERATTATINGFVGPVMERYLERLQGRMDGVQRLEILQSHGGRTDVAHAGRLPVHTVLSGPAGGVVGAVEAAREVGVADVITFDMGGTSTDVSLARSEVVLTEEGAIGGLPLQVPIIDIYTVGAGGGSIADVDAGGALRVGPRSAGADPGPAAYGRGGEATVTDAHVVLGSLRPDQFLGGAMELDPQAAHRAVSTVAKRLELSVEEAARGILDVADAAMARAIKVISLERGRDPRDYRLVSFGGAGGLHACRLARELEMPGVIVPRFPGILSATGMLRSDALRLFSQTVLRGLGEALADGGAAWLREIMASLEDRARREMGPGSPTLSWTGSLRYEGQSFSIPLEVDWGARRDKWSDPRPHFEDEHRRLYGYVAQGRAVELVDLRLQARLKAHRWVMPQPSKSAQSGATTVTADLGDGPQQVRVVARESLDEEERFQGPMIITEYSGTTVVGAGWSGEVQAGHLVLRDGEGR